MFTKKIHVFKAGDQTSAQGVQRNFSERDLKQVVDTYDPSIHEAPLVIGHAGDNDSTPAYGWIKGFSQQGGNLYADVAFTDTAKDLVKDGHYRKVSISFYSPESAINPHKGKWSARHLALLGASPPAVKGLEPFSFSEWEGCFDFAVALSPADIFDEELGPTIIVEKSPLQMLQEKLEEVRQDLSGSVKELQGNQQSQPTEELEEISSASIVEEPTAGQMANPDSEQFKETSKYVGREGTEITQQTADLEDQFPEEEFMEKGKISRKHDKGAHGQVMQVVENVYEEAHKEKQGYNDRLDESLGARNGKKSQSMKDRRDESEGMEKAMGKRKYAGDKSMDEKHAELSEEHKEKKQGYNDRLDESLGARNGKKSQSMKDRRDESEGMEKAMGKRKYAGDKSMDHSEMEFDEVSYKNSSNGKVSFGVKKEEIEGNEGRYETARSMDDGYVDRMKTGKAGADARTGRMATAKSSEQEDDRMHTAKNGEQQEDRMRTSKSGEFGKGDTGRWAGQQEDGYDKVHNMDQYDLAADEYPEPNQPETSDGTDPYGRKESATKIPVETEEGPDDTVFAVQMTNVMNDKGSRVMRQKSSSAPTQVATHNYMYGEPNANQMTGDDGVTTAKKGMNADKTVEHGEYDSGDLGGGASFKKLREEVGDGKPAKNKLLTPGAQDSLDDPAAIVGPDGAYAEGEYKSYKGDPKSKNKLLEPGAMDEVDMEAETVGPGGAYKEASLQQLREDIGDGKKSKARQLTPGAMDDVDTPAEMSKKSGGVYAEEHGERKDPYTKTGYGSTYDEGEGDSGVDEGEEDYNELSVDHACGMDYGMGMGTMGQKPDMGFQQKMYTELMNLKERYAELERRHAEEKRMHRMGQMASFVEALYEEGRLTDGIMPQNELLSYCEGLEFGTLEFSEGETSATKLLNLLSKLPPMVSFGEVAGGTFQYAEADLDPHARALQMVEQSEGKIDYVEALKKSMFN